MLEKGSESQTELLTPIEPVKGPVDTPTSQMRKLRLKDREPALAPGLCTHHSAVYGGASEAGDPWGHSGGVLPVVRLGPLPGPSIGWERSTEGWASPLPFLLPQKGGPPLGPCTQARAVDECHLCFVITLC